jgi:hypothetical protein
MPKTHGTTDLTAYALVAERILLFHEKYPSGQIVTDLISREEGEITFRARVYREPEDRRPSATGWASEVVGDGEINEVACLENTETSAVGRALANLGFTASRTRPSAEEMVKVARARARLDDARQASKPRMVREVPTDRTVQQNREESVADALLLADELDRAGVFPDKIREARDALAVPDIDAEKIDRIERTLRRWLQEHRQGRGSDRQTDQGPSTGGIST